jgi:hypothetical protein
MGSHEGGMYNCALEVCMYIKKLMPHILLQGVVSISLL